MSPILKQWLATLEGATLSSEGSREEIALANQQVFAVSRSDLMTLDGPQLETFLEAAIRIFARKLRGAEASFLFYAWFDEMSGTLRLSATRGRDWRDLPFRCRLELCQDAGAIVADFLAGEAVGGIPMTELEEVEFEPVELETSEDNSRDFVQRVFVRILPRLAS